MNTHRIHPEMVAQIKRVIETSKLSDNNFFEVEALDRLLEKHLYEGEQK